ncbi:hypothetical protein BSKO_09994 [Bryopsis sp. KO-2023]|nr:hypothetical protein BSKO_09994 [Bryopsis sp. KO-2023]
MRSHELKALLYGVMNIATASGIVFANKAVFQVFGFRFTSALTWIHTIFTLVGMRLFCKMGMFEHKEIPKLKLVPLAAAYVGYIVLCNLNLNINTVGFYQVSKIAVAPAVLGIEASFFGKRASRRVTLSVVVVCLGVGLATVTDTQVGASAMGLLIGLGAVISTSMYQIFAGTSQKELQAGSMQLLHEYTPLAAVMLGLLIPVLEPMGWSKGGPDTLLGYEYRLSALVAIILSAVLGLLVSLSTFLVIGATSSLTYNIVGHLKTVIILTGGCMFFGDEMPTKKFIGILVSLGGMMWYSQIRLQETTRAKQDAETLPISSEKAIKT